MKIQLSQDVAFKLLAYASATQDEFSGFGFCERREGVLHVYDFVLLDVGSYTYTEIEPRKILSLMDRPDAKNMKVFIHRHPIGNGVPGPHNWSSIDENTIRREPLGSVPKLIKWSASIVLTPRGWVGRIDNYLRDIAEHVEVVPSIRDFLGEVRALERAKPVTESEEDHTYDEDCPVCEGECVYNNQLVLPGFGRIARISLKRDHPQSMLFLTNRQLYYERGLTEEEIGR